MREILTLLFLLESLILITKAATSSSSTTTFCLQPDVPENCHVIFAQPGPYQIGTVAKYNCALGYERIGSDERKCIENGQWSGVAPLCAIDVAANKPAEQSSGQSTAQNAVLSLPNCALTDSSKSSWWSVNLLGTFDIRAISITLGHLSSELVDIRMETSNGTMSSCAREVSNLKNSTILYCSADSVRSIMVHAESRLHLCSIKVFAVNAQSAWQCALPSMDVLTLHDSNCYSASRMEKLDWKSAQKRCLDLGGSLPLRINPEAQAALRTALLSAQHSPSFYWIGLMGTSQGWKWADGDILEGGFEDWYEDPGEIKDGESLAVVMGRPAGWKWMTAAQSVWNPWICQTKPKFCTSPGVAENGRVVFSSQSYAIGTYSFYSCEPGFQLVGDHRRRCQSDGRWSTKIPVCKPVDCGPPPEWNHGTIHLINGSTAYGHLIEYKCRRGTLFESEENRIRRCGEDSYWTGIEPECIEVDCGQPSPIANGAVLVTSTTLNSTAVYSCDENFRLIGHSKSFCSESGHWHPAPPVCYDMLTLKEINDSSSSDKTLILCLVVAILLAILLLVAFKASQQRLRDQMIPNFNSWFRKGGIVCPVGGKSPVSDGPRHLVYAAPSQNHDSMIYYAPTGLSMLEGNHYLPGITEIEVPPHLLKRLPNGNIHVTLPPMRPTVRPSVLNAAHLIPPRGFPSMSHRSAPSPTSSQILYSFDHEPIYDQPPDTSNNIYEELITATQHTVC